MVHQRTENGITYNYTSKEESWRLEVIGDKARLELDTGELATMNDLYTFETEQEGLDKISELNLVWNG